MAISRQAMTDEQRKSVALEYLKAFDNKGVTSTGGSIMPQFIKSWGEDQQRMALTMPPLAWLGRLNRA